MSLGQTTCVALHGLDGAIVTVEVDIADGLPMYSLLGLPDAALNESRDRVRAALKGQMNLLHQSLLLRFRQRVQCEQDHSCQIRQCQ